MCNLLKSLHVILSTVCDGVDARMYVDALVTHVWAQCAGLHRTMSPDTH